jgi:hypothetical protein
MELKLELSVENTAISDVREFKATVILTNTTDKDLNLMYHVDGSSFGKRPSKAFWKVTQHGREVFQPKPRQMCGVINPLIPKNFFVLKSGESIDISRWYSRPRFSKAGKFMIQATYHNDTQMKITWASEEMIKKSREMDDCTAISNEVTITYTGKEMPDNHLGI